MSLNLFTIVGEGARRRPDAPAVIAAEAPLTYHELDGMARGLAGGLARLGVHRGQHVALLLPNEPAFPIAYFGALHLGATVVPLNTLLTPDEIAYHLKDSDAVALVSAASCLAQARAAMARSEACSRLVVAGEGAVEGASAPASGLWSLTALLAEAGPAAEPADTMPDDTAVILYTSGTTGRPKGAELTHFNLFYNAEQMGSIASLDGQTRGLCALPLFHSFGQTAVQNAVLRRGGAVILMQRFSPAAALDLIRRHGITYFAGVPTMYFALLNHQEPAGPPVALRSCISGGAPMPVEVMRAFDARFGVGVLESYGLSETSPVASANPSDGRRKPGSIGLPIENVEFRLVDEAGALVESSRVPGEICIRGPNIMKGYYKRPEATAEAIQGGWFRTGDIAVRDEDGFYFIVDRKKDMIIRAGYNVYPREIEEVLYAHPAVAEAAVVGVTDERLGEEVKAVLALRAGMTATAEEIVAYCRERLAAFKYPRIVEFRDVLPKGPTGKILKRALRA